MTSVIENDHQYSVTLARRAELIVALDGLPAEPAEGMAAVTELERASLTGQIRDLDRQIRCYVLIRDHAGQSVDDQGPLQP